jgi:hypothetical protein
MRYNMKPRNIDEFRATRRCVDNVDLEGDATLEDGVLDLPGYLYCGDQLYIYSDPDGRCWTVIENTQPEGKLAEVEQKLFEWALRAGYIDAPPPPYCMKCGKAMRSNVPRMGDAGGFVHADTGSLVCGPVQPLIPFYKTDAQRFEQSEAYIKKLDGLIEELGIRPEACINTYEDLKAVLLSLKADRKRLEFLLENCSSFAVNAYVCGDREVFNISPTRAAIDRFRDPNHEDRN